MKIVFLHKKLIIIIMFIFFTDFIFGCITIGLGVTSYKVGGTFKDVSNIDGVQKTY